MHRAGPGRSAEGLPHPPAGPDGRQAHGQVAVPVAGAVTLGPDRLRDPVAGRLVLPTARQ